MRRENLAAQAALEAQIQIYVKAGARTIADLYQQQANAASARLAVVQAERSSELARIEVIRTLRLDPRGTYEFVAPVITDPQQLTIDPLEELIGRALETRADIRASEARLEASRQDIRVARSTRWPTVSLSAGFGSSFSNDSDAAWNDQLDDERFVASYFAMEHWVNDNIPIAGETFRELVQALYQANRLVRGELALGQRRVELRNIRCPLLLLTADEDHLVPPSSTLSIVDHVGSPERQALSIDAGHVGLVVSSRAHQTLWHAATRWLAQHSTPASAATPVAGAARGTA